MSPVEGLFVGCPAQRFMPRCTEREDGGPRAHFLFVRSCMAVDPHSLGAMMRPLVESMGYELVGVEWRSGTRGTVRVYIDTPRGITVDDCERVSRQLSALLDVEDPIPGNYSLEVSSPGLDRPLFGEDDYRRFEGAEVRVKLHRPWRGRRKFQGLMNGVSQDGITLSEADGTAWTLPFELIESARLVPQL